MVWTQEKGDISLTARDSPSTKMAGIDRPIFRNIFTKNPGFGNYKNLRGSPTLHPYPSLFQVHFITDFRVNQYFSGGNILFYIF